MDELELLISDEILATISNKLHVNVAKCRTKLENVRIHYPKKLKSIEGISVFARARILLQLAACSFLDLHGTADPFKVVEKYGSESFIAATLLSSLGIAKGSPNKLLELFRLGNRSQSLEELTRIHKLGILFLTSMHAANTEAIGNVFDRVSSVVTVDASLVQFGVDLGGAEKGIQTHILSLALSSTSKILAGIGKSEFETNRTWMIRFLLHQQSKLKQPTFTSAALQVVLDEVIETPEQFETILKVIREIQSQGIKLNSPVNMSTSLFNTIKGKCLTDILAPSITSRKRQFASSPAIKSNASKFAVNEESSSLEMSSSIPVANKSSVTTQRLPAFALTSRRLDALQGRNALGGESAVTKVEPINEVHQAPLSTSVQSGKEQSVSTVNKLKVALKARSKKV